MTYNKNQYKMMEKSESREEPFAARADLKL